MTRIKMLATAASVAAAGLLFGTQGAQAHCNSVDGLPPRPEWQRSARATSTWLCPTHLPRPKARSRQPSSSHSRSPRLGRPPRRSTSALHRNHGAVASRRQGGGLHRLEAAGIDYGPAIPAAESAVATGDLTQVKALLTEEGEHGLNARLAHVIEESAERRRRGAVIGKDGLRRASASAPNSAS